MDKEVLVICVGLDRSQESHSQAGSATWVTRLDQPKGVKHKVKRPKLQEDVGPQQGP